MENGQIQDKGLRTCKSYAGISGFVLALLGFISFGLTAIPALVFCIIGTRQKRYRTLAWVGLAMSFVGFCILFLCILPFTPGGSVPYPLNLLKYRLACKSHFWLTYDQAHIIKAQSQNTLILSIFGSIHFKADRPGYYRADDIIRYAEQNGWVYGGKIHLTKEDFYRFRYDSQKFADENYKLYEAICLLSGYNSSPLWIQDTCTALGFDTGNVHGIPSYVMILDDGSEMVVRANHHRLPDPAYRFELPELFEKPE